MKKFFKNFNVKSFLRQRPSQSAISTSQTCSQMSDNNFQIKNHVINNRYSFCENTLAVCIDKIAKTSMAIPYIIKKDGEVVNDSNTSLIDNAIKKPSLRQPTFEQFLQDAMKEYLLNGIIFILIDLETEQLRVLKTSEVAITNNNLSSNVEVVGQSIYKYTIWKNMQLGQREDYYLDIENGYYINSKKTQILLPSDIEFEDFATQSTGLVFLSKSMLNQIANFVYLQNLIIAKNKNLLQNKNSGDVTFINAKGDLTQQQQEELSNTIHQKITSVNNNGKPVFIFGTEIEASNIKLNDGEFESQFMDVYQICEKEIFKSYAIPIEKGAEQAKYSNAQNGSMEFLEQAIKPPLNFTYAHITRALHLLYEGLEDYELEADYSESNVVKEYNADFALKIKEFLSINEIRERLGYEPRADGDTLTGNNTMQNLFNE